jgi:DNA adenine methylase
MKYLGGKHEIGRRISAFLEEQCPPNLIKGGYLEPFCGSLGVFKHMTDKGYKKYIAADIQPDLILMWKKIQKNTLNLPKTISADDYEALKKRHSPNALKAVAGFGLSFGGKFFGGYAQKWSGKSGRNFYSEFKASIEKIKPAIRRKNVHFYNKSYINFKPHGMLIYCDPPYKHTQNYSTGEFDYDTFWSTMRLWSKDNCVFISEETAPSDFQAVFKHLKRRTLDKNKAHTFNRYEKIFAYRGTSVAGTSVAGTSVAGTSVAGTNNNNNNNKTRKLNKNKINKTIKKV